MKKINTGLVLLIMLLLTAVICLALWMVLGKDTNVPSNDIYQNGGQGNNDSVKVDETNLTSFVDLKKCLNCDDSIYLPEVLETYYGLQVVLKEGRWYIKLVKDSELANTYSEALTDTLIEIKGLDSSKVVKWYITKNGSDLRMQPLLFLMQDGTVMYLNTYKALTSGESSQIALTLDGVYDVETIETVSLGSSGYITLALTRKGVAYAINTNGESSKISIPTYDTLNINTYDAVKNLEFEDVGHETSSANVMDGYFYGLVVEHKEDNFYICLVKDSDLAKDYADLLIDHELKVTGIDASKVAKVIVAGRSSDLRMPSVLFLMEDGTVYELNSFTALSKKDACVTQVENVTGVIHITSAYIENTPGYRYIGITESGDFYLV